MLAQLNGPWDGTAAVSGLWLMMSLGLSQTPKVSVSWLQPTKNKERGRRPGGWMTSTVLFKKQV